MPVPSEEGVFLADGQDFAFSCKPSARAIKLKRAVGAIPVKRVALFVGLVFGAGVGLLTSLADGIGLKIVMMSIGAVAGAAIGGAIARIGNRRLRLEDVEESYGLGTSPEDRVSNFWRDKGKLVPFSGPPDPQGTRHDFDRERL